MNRPGAISRAVRAFVLGTVLAVVPTVSYPLGLGSLKVKSALNEPLNAEIDFTSINKRELKNLNVALAPRGDFDAAGVDRPPHLSEIRFTLSKRLDGQPFLQLTSEQPIREPFLHFLIKVEWAGGRLVREFTALIDPPTLFAGAPPAVQVPEQAPQIAPAAVAEPLPAPVIAGAPSLDVAPAMPEPAPAASSPSVTEQAPPSAAEPTTPTPLETTVAAAEPLGPPQPSESGVAISAETGWPTISPASSEPAAGKRAPPPPSASVTPSLEPIEPVGTPAVASVPAIGSWANTRRYEVKRGDTLWGIAQKIRVDPTVSLEQVIMALYEANRDAFFQNNVNNVWAGEVLLIPEREELETRSRRDARQVFLAHYGDWQAYKLKLASASQTMKVAAAPEQAGTPADSATSTPATTAQAAPAPAPERKPGAATPKTAEAKPAKPKPAAKPEQPPAETAAPTPEAQQPQPSTTGPVVATRPKPPGDLLKIVRAAIESEGQGQGKVAEGESGDTGQKERLALAERATTLDETLQSKQLEQKEMGERVGTHQSQIEKQRRLIELNNEPAAKTKDALTESQATPPAEVAKQPEKPAESQPAPEKVAKAETPAKATPPAAERKPKAAPQAKPGQPTANKRPRRVQPAPAPAQDQGVMAMLQNLKDMLGSYLMQAVAAVVALAGGLILLTYLRRRRAAEAEFEESILTDTDAMTEGATTDSGGTQGSTSSAGSTSFLSDFSQGGMGNISTDEVDPIAETEVYLAYGRDEQAEEILKDAVAKDPSRHELKLKLLEIYAQRKDVGAFETLAEELYAAQEGRGGDLWNHVAEMGRKLNPDNPMFQALAPADEPSLPTSLRTTPALKAASAADALDFEPPTGLGGAEASGLDFAPDSERVEQASTGLDFDLDLEGSVTEPKAHAGAGEAPIPDTAELSAEELRAGMEEEALGLGEQPAENVGFDMTTEDREPQLTAGQAEEPSWELGTGGESELALETAAEAGVSTGEAEQWDETATKLDLAKAYVDMGDAEGARSILDEVLAEGNDDQKRQAAELAAQLA